MRKAMPERPRSRANDLAPWVFLLALMAVALVVTLTMFALPSPAAVPSPVFP